MEIVGIGNIKQQFDLYKTSPYFALFFNGATNQYAKAAGKVGEIIFGYKGDDRDGEGWDMLQQTLKAGEVNAPSCSYVLRFYDSLDNKGNITDGTPCSGSFRLRMNDYQAAEITGVKGAAGGSDLMSKLFDAKLENFSLMVKHQREDDERRHQKELEDMRAALDAAEEEEEIEEEADEVGKVMRTIGAVGEQYPWLQQTISKLGNSFADLISYGGIKARNFMRDNTQHHHQPMNGVHDTAEPPVGDYTTERYAADMKAHLDVLRDFFVRTYVSMDTPAGKLKGLQEMARAFETLAHLAQVDPDKLEFAILKLHKERG